MRLIDANELKSKKEYSQERHEWIVPVAAIDWIRSISIESLRPQGRWIRVKDRLPEPETRVLALTENKNVIAAMYEDGTMWRDASRWNFYDLYGFEYNEEQDDYLVPEGWWEYTLYCEVEENYPVEDKVTHWMSLPLPPAEVRNGT